MPTFRFTSPEGKTYDITGPEGATAEQAFSMLQQQQGAPAPQAAAQPEATEDFPSEVPAAAPAAPEAPQPGLFSKERLGLQGIERAPAMIARGIGTGLTGTVGMVGDALNTAINMGGRALGHDPQLGLPSQQIQGLMTKAGLPTPTTGNERALAALTSLVSGGKDPVMGALTKRFLPAASTPTLNPRQQAIREGQQMGYVVPPTEARGGSVGTAIEGLSGRSTLYNAMSLRNQAVTDATSRRIAGIRDDMPLTDETLTAAKQATHEAGYGPIRDIGTITTGRVYRKALDKVLTDFQGAPGSFPLAARNDVRDLVNAFRVRDFNSAHAIDAIQNLRADATQAFRLGNSNLGKAQTAVAKALEDNIELNLQGMGQNGQQMLGGFRAARTQLAKQNIIQRALEKGTGEVNAQKLAGELNRRGEGYMTGELATMAKFAKNAAKVTKVPQVQSVPIMRNPLQNSMATAIAGALGGPLPATVVAAAPFSQAGLRGLMMSPQGQRMIGPQLDPNILAKLAANKSVVNAMPTAIQQTGLFGPQ